eukprot:768070-Hanusia_phi.AAC.4
MLFSGVSIVQALSTGVQALGTAGLQTYDIEARNIRGQSIRLAGAANATDFIIQVKGPTAPTAMVVETCKIPPCIGKFWFGDAAIGGIFRVSFLATVSGFYNVDNLFKGLIVGGGNGRVVFQVNPGVPYASNCRAAGASITGSTAGVLSSFQLLSYDEYSNPIQVDGTTEISSFVIRMNNCSSCIAVQVVNPAREVPRVEYYSTVAGTYSYTLYLRGSDGVDRIIAGQPSTFTIWPAIVQPASSNFTPSISSLTAGSPIQFTIFAKDAFGNVQRNKLDNFIVTVFEFSSNRDIIRTFSTASGPLNGIYYASLSNQLSITISGTYRISVQIVQTGLVFTHISGSPFSLTTYANVPNASSIYLSASPDVLPIATKTSTFCLVSTDIYGNRRTLTDSEAKLLNLTVQGKSSDPRWPDVTCINSLAFSLSTTDNVGLWCATFSCNFPGIAVVIISFNSRNISGSPYLFAIAKSEGPKLQAAQFQQSGAAFEVTFDRDTDQGGVKGIVACELLLDAATVATLGVQSSCVWLSPTTLQVTLGARATIRVGGTVTIARETIQTLSKDSDWSAGETSLQAPSSMPLPTIVVRTSNFISYCEDMIIDATSSYGGGGRSMTFTWGVLPGPFTTSLASYLRSILITSNLTIPNSLLVPGTTYVFILRVENVFGGSTESQIRITISDLPIPYIYILGSSTRHVDRQKDIILEGYAALSLCKSNSSNLTAEDTSMTFEWTITSSDTFALDETTYKSRKLLVRATDLIVGKQYTLQLKGFMNKNPSLFGLGNLTLIVDASPISAFIDGGSRSIFFYDDLTLDASASEDPDLTPDPWSFTWNCEILNKTGVPCFDDTTGILFTEASKITVPAGLLAPGNTYRFTVNAVKGPGPRYDSTFVNIKVLSVSEEGNAVTTANVFDSTIEIYIKPLKQKKVSAVAALTLQGEVKTPTDKSFDFYWTLLSGDVTQSFKTLTTLQNRFVVFAAGSFYPGKTYTARLTCAMKDAAKYSYADISFTINSVPGSGYCRLNTTQVVALQEPLEASCFEWADSPDDEPLSYSWRSYQNLSDLETFQLVTRASVSNIQTIRVPPPEGVQYLSAQICDIYNGCTLSEIMRIAVLSPNQTAVVGDSINALGNALNVGDESSALQTIFGVSQSLRSGAQQGNRRLLADEYQAVKSMLISATDSLLNQAALDDKAIEQYSGCLSNAMQITESTSSESRNQTRQLIDKLMTNSIALQVDSRNSFDNFANMIGFGIKETLSQNGTLEEAELARNQLDGLSSVVLAQSVPGQDFVKLTTGLVPITLAKLSESSSQTDGLSLALSSGGFFSLPQEGVGNLSTSGVTLKMFEFDPTTNIHVASKDKQEVLGGSIMFELVGLSVTTMNPIHFRIPLKQSSTVLNSSNSSAQNVTSIETCTYWDNRTNTWTGTGCAVKAVEDDAILCECFHLTEFTALGAAGNVQVMTVDPVGDSAALLSASGVQLIIILSMASIFALYFIAIFVGTRRDFYDYSVFAKSPAKYMRSFDAQLKASKYSILNEVQKMMAEKHVIYHIIRSRPYSALTRPQMITTFFCFVASSMTSNAIFYGVQPAGPGEALRNGVLSSLITIPSTIFFVMIFRKARKREAKKIEPTRRRSSLRSFASFLDPRTSRRSKSKKNVVMSRSGTETEPSQSSILHRLGRLSTRFRFSSRVMPLAEKNERDLILERKAYARYERQIISVQRARIAGAKLKGIQHTAGVRSWWLTAREGQDGSVRRKGDFIKTVRALMAARKASNVFLSHLKSRNTIGHRLKAALEKNAGKPSKPSKFVFAKEASLLRNVPPLPSWVTYFAYVLAICFMAFCIYLNMLFAITFEEVMAVGWVTGSSLSTVQKLLITDPINVILTFIALFLLQKYFDMQQAEARRRLRIRAMFLRDTAIELMRKKRSKNVSAFSTIIDDFAADLCFLPGNLHSNSEGVYMHRSLDAVYEYSSKLLGVNEECKGVLHWIGSSHGTAEHQNPVLIPFGVTVSAAKSSRDALEDLSITEMLCEAIMSSETDDDSKVLILESHDNRPWISVDLGEGRGLIATAYSIMHGSGSSTNALRSWRLEGSNNKTNWTTLREHYNDPRMQRAGQVETFFMQNLDSEVTRLQAFRHFRISLTGPNSSNAFSLCVCRLELYGRYIQLRTKLTQEHESAAVIIQRAVKEIFNQRRGAPVPPPGNLSMRFEVTNSDSEFSAFSSDSLSGSDGEMPATPPSPEGMSPAESPLEPTCTPSLEYRMSRFSRFELDDIEMGYEGWDTDSSESSDVSSQRRRRHVAVKPYRTISVTDWRAQQELDWHQQHEGEEVSLGEIKVLRGSCIPRSIFFMKLSAVHARSCFREWRVMSCTKPLLLKRMCLRAWFNFSRTAFVLQLEKAVARVEVDDDSRAMHQLNIAREEEHEDKWVDVPYLRDESGRRSRGIFHWISTNGFQHDWVNPCEPERFRHLRLSLLLADNVTLTSGQLGELVKLGTQFDQCMPMSTDDVAGAWIVIDFGTAISVSPTHYSLRHGRIDREDMLRSWNLEGSQDLSNWHILSQHINDETIRRPMQLETFEVKLPQLGNTYRYLRLVMTGRNSSGNHSLSVSGLEVYGRIFRGQAANLLVRQLARAELKPRTLLQLHLAPASGLNLVHLRMTEEFDTHGLFYFLGTDAGASAYKNPAMSGLVEVSHNEPEGEMCDGDYRNVTGREVSDLYSSDRGARWIAVHLGEGRHLVPSHYTLRHGFTTSAMLLRYSTRKRL